MTPTQAKESIRVMLADTIAFLDGPAGWEPYQDTPGEECTVSGHRGRDYYWAQLGPGTGTAEARDAPAEKLKTHLEDEGYTTYIAERNPNDPNLRVYASDGAVAKFSAYISPEGISIQAVSWCVVGTDTASPTP